MQDLLISFSTGGEGDNETYIALRQELLNNPLIKTKLPDFIESKRTLAQYWQFIKYKFSTYAERRGYIWSSFSELLTHVEGLNTHSPGEIMIANKFLELNEEYIRAEWEKAIQRKHVDPEGAITISRTLIETTCKYILDQKDISYEDTLELPKLYKLVANNINLSPDTHTEQVFKQILGGCQTVVEGLGSLRNKLSDAHGRKKSQLKPHSRHAELAINLAGAMCIFLIDVYINQSKNQVSK